MKVLWIACTALLVGLGGCAAQLEKDATAGAVAHCQSEGKQFVKTDSEKSDGLIISKAQVAGVCIGPDDPRWVKPK